MSSVSYDTYKTVQQNSEKEIKQFLDVVFRQVETEKFYQIFQEAMKNHENDGMGVYRELLARAHEAQGGPIWKIKAGFRALKEERETLAENITKISDPLYTRHGYLEINMPFRMGANVRQSMGIIGESALVNDKERPTDILQCGFPRPYQVFVPYGDDTPLKRDDFPFPIDVIGMFAGAHHCQPKNLKALFQSIYDLLEPNGVFLLRDHDAKTDDLKAIADVAHRFFNALTNVSEADEIAEVRNFQSLAYFIRLAQEVGFKVASEPLVRTGDSTQNALIKFYKPTQDKAQAQIGFIRELLINACRQRTSTKSYFRDEKQTHLTKVEWLNVEQEQAQAEFYQNNFFINYPHHRDAIESASVYKKSFQAAREKTSFKEVALSDYTVMNTTIMIATGVHNLAKSIFYTPCSWLSKLGGLLPHQENPEWEKPTAYYGEWLDKYSKSLEVIPSYEHPYYQNLKGFFNVLRESYNEARKNQSLLSLLVDRQTVKNLTTSVALTGDLLWRQLFASTVKAIYGGQENADAREIGVIVKTTNKKNPFERLADKVKVVVEEEGNPYKGIIVPRYGDLTRALETLSKDGIEVVEIAGQTALEIEFVADRSGDFTVVDGVQEIYRRHYYFDEKKEIVACMVPVNTLHKILKQHSKSIHRIYDF